MFIFLETDSNSDEHKNHVNCNQTNVRKLDKKQAQSCIIWRRGVYLLPHILNIVSIMFFFIPNQYGHTICIKTIGYVQDL